MSCFIKQKIQQQQKTIKGKKTTHAAHTYQREQTKPLQTSFLFFKACALVLKVRKL